MSLIPSSLHTNAGLGSERGEQDKTLVKTVEQLSK